MVTIGAQSRDKGEVFYPYGIFYPLSWTISAPLALGSNY